MDPVIIQGGMGVGISGWMLARAVSTRGQLGVVSGTALDAVLVRRLQDGDPGGHYRRALEAFPIPAIAREALDRYFRPSGRGTDEPYALLPLYKRVLDARQEKLIVLANFAEVYLAREGHGGAVGVNYLSKIQIPTLASLYGAMLAGVGWVLMGAGIPREVPGALDRFAAHEPASIRMDVVGSAAADDDLLSFDPGALWSAPPAPLDRPRFLPIVASNSLATMMARKANGRVDGFVVEGPTAGGHNAPPRGGGDRNERGEPLYGDRDRVDLAKLSELGLPFWVAGGAGTPGGLADARAAGAAGIQVGTLFAYCDESGLSADLKADVLRRCRNGGVDVLTDGRASPTGFPFKVVDLPGTLAQDAVYEARERVCDLGYLRTAYRRDDGRIGYRCPGEPVGTWVKKGGDPADAVGRKCLCNALVADLGMGQVRPGGRTEPALLTSGDDLARLHTFLDGRARYSAADVVDHLMIGVA
jgi:NAD(P)H-dependent flavin oxidoreductase YrpB (nitropropane dioxygenase family)